MQDLIFWTLPNQTYDSNLKLHFAIFCIIFHLPKFQKRFLAISSEVFSVHTIPLTPLLTESISPGDYKATTGVATAFASILTIPNLLKSDGLIRT